MYIEMNPTGLTLTDLICVAHRKRNEDTGFSYAVQSCRCSNCRYASEGKCSLKECCCMAERVRAHTCMCFVTGEPCEWSLVIAIYAVKTNRTEDVVTFDDEKAGVLKEVYRNMNRMDVHTEQITVKETHLETQEDGSVVSVEQKVVKTYLYIDTVPLTAEEAANLYGFDAKQREQFGELLSDKNKEMWDALLLQQ